MKKDKLATIIILVALSLALAACSSQGGQAVQTGLQSSPAPSQGAGMMQGTPQAQPSSPGAGMGMGGAGGGMMRGPTVTAAELAAHSSQSDCWVGYAGEVYDITNFLPIHPGGVYAISRYCGTSTQFEQAFLRKHGTRHVDLLKAYGVDKGALVS